MEHYLYEERYGYHCLFEIGSGVPSIWCSSIEIKTMNYIVFTIFTDKCKNIDGSIQPKKVLKNLACCCDRLWLCFIKLYPKITWNEMLFNHSFIVLFNSCSLFSLLNIVLGDTFKSICFNFRPFPLSF